MKINDQGQLKILCECRETMNISHEQFIHGVFILPEERFRKELEAEQMNTTK